MRLTFLLVALAWAGDSRWISIAGRPYQYFRYGSGKSLEMVDFSAQNVHFSHIFAFEKAPAPMRAVCRLEDRPDVHWFTPDGRKLAGTFAAPNPTEFSVSEKQSGISGFGVKGKFSGRAKAAGAVEVVYFTDRACSDGGTEFGFERDLATNNLLIYWSTYSNCGNDAASLCRKTDDGALGANIQQENSGTAVEHGFRIYGLDWDAEYTYRIAIEGRAFRVEVLRGGAHAQCADSESGPRGKCSFLKPVQPWFPIESIREGYIVAGTQTAGEPVPEKDAKFAVSDILVLK